MALQVAQQLLLNQAQVFTVHVNVQVIPVSEEGSQFTQGETKKEENRSEIDLFLFGFLKLG